ncbi:MAG: pyrroline-5-carboxylate reductase [Tepidisphaeraceae bacterium]|jgi:pyrroline-5-carboxylate reductase
MTHELAIIGAGVMAEAIARGIVSAGTLKPAQIVAADLSPERRELFNSTLHINAVENGAQAAAGARIVLLSVKPYQMEEVLRGLSPAMEEQSLVISIAAGISSAFIEKTLGRGKRWRVVRAMPNMPMLAGCGMVAIAPGANAGKDDLAAARKLFESGAKVLELGEEKIDAVTAISGSGPAYFFFLAEQMIQAGIEMGLSAEEARTLAIQTAAGAAKIMSGSDDSPASQRRLVTTPNGTTHAAISQMEKENWPRITIDAMKAAQRRSREMGK